MGFRQDIPVPQNSDRTDLNGEWVVPAAGGRIAVGEAANLMVLHAAPDAARERPDRPRISGGAWSTGSGKPSEVYSGSIEISRTTMPSSRGSEAVAGIALSSEKSICTGPG